MRFSKDDSGEPFDKQAERRIDEFAMMLIDWHIHARNALIAAEDGYGPEADSLADLAANADTIALWCDMTHPGIDPTPILELTKCLDAAGMAYRFRNDDRMTGIVDEFDWRLPMPEVQRIAARARMVFDRILSVVMQNPKLSPEIIEQISADTEKDTGGFLTVKSEDVLSLIECLKRNRDSGKSDIEIAREFVGNLPDADRKAANLLRSARRHRARWK